MSYIGNTPGVSSQRVVLEQVVTGSPQSAFTPVGGYTLGYVDVLVNGTEIDSSDFTASDGVTVTLATAAAVGDTVKIKTWLPRGLSDGYLKTEADARYVAKTGSTMGGGTFAKSGTGNISFDNGTTDTPGVKFYYADNTNFGNDVMGSRWRLVKNLDETGGAELVVVDTSGNMSLQTGNLVLSNGKGIDFSATSQAGGMQSELLDDYEKGVWTPSAIRTYGTGTVTNGSVGGYYVKVGKLVTVWFYLNLTTSGVSGSNIGISGLPFAVSSVVSTFGNFNGGSVRQDAVGGFMFFCESAHDSQIEVIRRYDNGSLSDGGPVLRGSFSYLTD